MEISRPDFPGFIGSLFGKLRTARRTVLSPRLVMVTTFAGMSLINYAFGLAMGWLLVPGDFGLLAFSQTVLSISGLVLNSGFAWSLTYRLVRASEREKPGLVRGALIANLLLAVTMSLLVGLTFAAGFLKTGLETWTITGLIMLALPFLALVAIARATVQGYERFKALAALWIIETGVKAVIGIGLVQAGFNAAGATAGFLGGSFFASLVGLLIIARRLKIRLFGSIELPSLRAAGAMFSALLGMALLLNLDVLALKLASQADRGAVGWYQAGIILANTPYYLLTATIPILFTQVARRKEMLRSVSLVGETFQLALVVLLPIEVIMAIFPDLPLRVFFPAVYSAGAPALQILALGNAAIILVAILSATFQASGNPAVPGRVLLTITFLEVFALRAIVPVWHGRGAALTFSMAATGALFVLGFKYYSFLDKISIHKGLYWLMKYACAVTIGFICGWAAFAATHNTWIAVGLGGSCYGAATMGLKLFSISRFFRQSTEQSPLAEEKE